MVASVKQDWILRRTCKLAVSESTLTSNNSLVILKHPQLLRSSMFAPVSPASDSHLLVAVL